MKTIKILLVITIVVLIGSGGYIISKNLGHDQHEHDESSETLGESQEDGLEEAQDEHEEYAIELEPEEVEEIGLKTSLAGPGDIDIYLTLPGQIGFNEDKMAHIVPRVEGRITEVKKKLGDNVKANEIIAWLESSTLGNVKLEYVDKWSEVTCCDLDLTRAQQIHDNTIKLLSILDESPSLETLRSVTDIEMGENRSKLISAYAEYSLAEEYYEREKSLFEQKISSEQDFLNAQSSFKKADAQYTAMRDSVAFEIKRNLLEAQNARQLQIMELKGAERQLKILGITNEDIKELELLVENQTISLPSEDDCDDPNCTECLLQEESLLQANLDSIKAEEKLAWYPLIAPFDGTIISKHITIGEMANEDSEVFVIADLNTVWVDLQVYPKDLKYITKGQQVIISSDSEIPEVNGEISYISPVVSEESRNALARIVLSNESGLFRPGLFVNAKVSVSKTRANIVVPKQSIQTLEGQKCVFVKDEHDFEPVFVETGLESATHVEINSGLVDGQEYVTDGAFLLKSKLITSTLGSHAGHGH